MSSQQQEVNNHDHDLSEDIKFLTDNLKIYQDFPKKGIAFRDTLSLFRNPIAFRKVIDLFSRHISNLNVDAVVGLEARGFVLGGAIAYNLNIPFVPIRKKGKLPGKVISYKYELEYGSDIFEVQEDSLNPGQRVVIVDDLLATGGSCSAAIELLKLVNVEVVECVVLVEFTDLDWSSKVKSKATSFIKINSSA